jgi:hypothetical protein
MAAYASSSESTTEFAGSSSSISPSDCVHTADAAVSIAAAAEVASTGIMKSTQLPILLQFSLEVRNTAHNNFKLRNASCTQLGNMLNEGSARAGAKVVAIDGAVV